MDKSFVDSTGRYTVAISQPALTRAIVDQRNLKELLDGRVVMVQAAISVLTGPKGNLNFFINPKLMLVIGNEEEESRGLTGIWAEGEGKDSGQWFRLSEPNESWRTVYTTLVVAAGTLPDLKWYTDSSVVRADIGVLRTISVMPYPTRQADYDYYRVGGQLANCQSPVSGSEEGGLGSLPSRLLAHYNYLLSL